MKKGDTYTVEITGYTSEGAGIARIDGMAVFVPLALCGELCEIMILKKEKSFAFAKLLKVIKKSPARVESECKYFPVCGGCDLWHMSYDEELKLKEERVREAMRRIAGLDVEINPIIRADNIMRYRNKAQFPVKGNSSGFFRPRSHDIVPSETCLIQSKLADRVRSVVHRWQKEFSVSAYDEKSGKGMLRHIYVRSGKGGAILCLVVKKQPDKLGELSKMIERECPEVCGIVLNINNKMTNVILGDKYVTVSGKETLSDELCGNEFSISPAAFYQVNHAQTEKLYELAVSLATEAGAKVILDLYCGIGTITLSLAKRAERVIGVEIVPQAIEDAKKNAKINGIKNAEFICADATPAAMMLQKRGEKPDTVVVDPPRKGLSAEVIKTIKEMAPKTVVYVSCDPATLARDLKIFAESGEYEVSSVQPVDMFPRTKHCETVALLSRLRPDDVIEVELKSEDLHLTSAEAKATYQQIKDYIFRKYGFKVSSLYIAQVKQKMGLPMGKNYNTSKKGTKVPVCPPEKEKAIKDALEHFKMV